MNVEELIEKAENDIQEQFRLIEKQESINSNKVMQAFWNNNAIISPSGGAVNYLHRIVTDMIPKSQFLSLVKKAKTR